MVNPLVDAAWRFMTLDTDGKIRMDCSSPRDGWLIRNDVRQPERYQIAPLATTLTPTDTA